MTDKFFTTQNCDRCQASLEGKARQLSWFTEECLCPSCQQKEKELRNKLEARGKDTSELEGCGYLPQLNGE